MCLVRDGILPRVRLGGEEGIWGTCACAVGDWMQVCHCLCCAASCGRRGLRWRMLARCGRAALRESSVTGDGHLYLVGDGLWEFPNAAMLRLEGKRPLGRERFSEACASMTGTFHV